MKNFLFAAAFVLISSTTFASDNWRGEGTLYGVDGQEISKYNLFVKIEATSLSTEKHTVRVELADGSIQVKSCELSKSGNSWSKVCDGSQGSGSGYCFDHDLCQDYFKEGEKAHATQIIFDSENEMRLLRTELFRGEAKHFFAESLTKDER